MRWVKPNRAKASTRLDKGGSGIDDSDHSFKKTNQCSVPGAEEAGACLLQPAPRCGEARSSIAQLSSPTLRRSALCPTWALLTLGGALTRKGNALGPVSATSCPIGSLSLALNAGRTGHDRSRFAGA